MQKETKFIKKLKEETKKGPQRHWLRQQTRKSRLSVIIFYFYLTKWIKEKGVQVPRLLKKGGEFYKSDRLVAEVILY